VQNSVTIRGWIRDPGHAPNPIPGKNPEETDIIKSTLMDSGHGHLYTRFNWQDNAVSCILSSIHRQGSNLALTAFYVEAVAVLPSAQRRSNGRQRRWDLLSPDLITCHATENCTRPETRTVLFVTNLIWTIRIRFRSRTCSRLRDV